jgi:hypothetical protein
VATGLADGIDAGLTAGLDAVGAAGVDELNHVLGLYHSSFTGLMISVTFIRIFTIYLCSNKNTKKYTHINN